MLLELKNITKSYTLWEEVFHVLSGVNLDIEEWEFVAIMWPSGSGKSTLMNIIWMLDTPTSWEFFMNGKRVDNLSDSKQSRVRRESIGFIFSSYQPSWISYLFDIK